MIRWNNFKLGMFWSSMVGDALQISTVFPSSRLQKTGDSDRDK